MNWGLWFLCLGVLIISFVTFTQNEKLRKDAYALPTYDIDGMVADMDAHESKLEKIEAGMKHIFGDTYLDDEFPTSYNQANALVICVVLALRGNQEK